MMGVFIALSWPVASVWIAFFAAGGIASYALFRDSAGGSAAVGARWLEKLSGQLTEVQRSADRDLNLIHAELSDIKAQVAELQRVLTQLD